MSEFKVGVSLYKVTLRGVRPLAMHDGAASLDKHSSAGRSKSRAG